MNCNKCKLYEDSPLWNRCNLIDAECFYTYNDSKPCPYIDDDYICIINCEPLGLVKGEDVLSNFPQFL